MLSPSIPLKIEKIKRKVLDREGLAWTDFLIICTIAEMRDSTPFIKPIDLIKSLERDRCWVYASLRKLSEKGFITLLKRHRAPELISLTGWATVLLNRAEYCYNGQAPYMHEDDKELGLR